MSLTTTELLTSQGSGLEKRESDRAPTRDVGWFRDPTACRYDTRSHRECPRRTPSPRTSESENPFTWPRSTPCTGAHRSPSPCTSPRATRVRIARLHGPTQKLKNKNPSPFAPDRNDDSPPSGLCSPPPPQAPTKAGPWIPGIDVHVAESFQVGGWGVGFGGYGRVEAEPKRREAGGWGSGVDVELRRGLDCCESRTAVFRKLKTFLARAQTSLVLNPEIQKLGHLRATTPLRVRPDDVHPIVFDEGPPGGELLGRQVVVLDEF